MNYFTRFLAAIPALSVGIAILLFVTAAFDYPILGILAAVNSLAFILLLDNIDNIEKTIKDILKILAK